MRSFFELTRRELSASLERPFRATQLYMSVYQRWVDNLDLITELPKSLRASLEHDLDIRLPPVVQRFQSRDGTRRYLIRLSDGQLAETVFIPEAARSTVCISSQIGCALACAFCLTGQLGLVRHLTPGEMVAQALVAQRDNLDWEHKDSFNIVLMGMGEPLHNYDNVMVALGILHDSKGLNMSMSRVTLSTAGLAPAIERLAAEPLRPSLAISMTGTTDAQRDRLMPINRTFPIERVLEAVRRFPLRDGQRVTFEYVLIEGVTDTPGDARRLARWLRGIRAKVNLIPLNESEELGFGRPREEGIARFARVLLREGIPTFIRRERGADISAACGQLKQKWTGDALSRPHVQPA